MVFSLLTKALPLALLGWLAAVPPTPPHKTKVYLIGDSTMARKIPATFPETGWGMPLVTFFDSTVVVDNRAQNGRSTRTFLAENRWQPVVQALQPGDYVFIQFGHNDESVANPERYASPEDYRINLVKFVTETRGKKGIPVLLTPVSRRYFDQDGRIKETHVAYSATTRAVAKASNVLLVDMDELSRTLLQKLGDEKSKLLFMQLAPGDHPNYPLGRNDNTHFNELGARLMAQLVIHNLQAQHVALVEEHLAKPLPKNAVATPTGAAAQPTTP
ncbi:rhamnogalacturonan acetylesterase [Hymenobacter sp. UV11]|uniref:rhamnogalacturonan acetylesterase n=1 Tax=Hymenobacter sp. UV11 TaxID=1849735 RepID=UPI0010603956|nr:rhamnogalacturonan acetylesterase [Hymenobacter sp. UV11]TDN40501.1 GntR family transcriptional regulator [Hymenobacter sp. UV11]TFZ66484.1 rhamnogalacturonan acetylesterase [Hymenobacter sp. UV11]